MGRSFSAELNGYDISSGFASSGIDSEYQAHGFDSRISSGYGGYNAGGFGGAHGGFGGYPGETSYNGGISGWYGFIDKFGGLWWF